MKGRTMRIFSLIIAAAVILGGCSKKAADTGVKPVRIGVVIALSGSRAAGGEYARQAVEMWKEEVTARGGILGRPVEIVYEDDGETEQSYMNAVVKTLSSNNVCAVYSDGFSDYVRMVSPEVARYEIAFMDNCSSQSVLDMNNRYIWINRMTDSVSSPTIAKACKEMLNMSRPAVLHVTDAFGEGLNGYLQAAIKDLGLTVAADISFTIEERQFTPYLVQVANNRADGIIGLTHQEQGALIMRQVYAMQMGIPLMGCSQYATATAIETAGEAANGWYTLADWTNEVETLEGKKFVQDYIAKFNRPPDMQSVNAYDAMLIFEDAITRAATDEAKAVNDAIYKTKDLKGAMTTYSYDGSNTLAETINLVQIVNGSGRLIDIVHR